MKNNQRYTISVVGPSTRFLSGISYYTIRLCNALSTNNRVNAILFRNMLPKRLFPGWKRVGQSVPSLQISPKVHIFEVLDWYDPLSWAKGAKRLRNSDVVILEWWTSSVVHMFFALVLLSGGKTRIVIEFHEVVDPLEFAILPLRIYAKTMGRIIRGSAYQYVVHSDHDRHLIASQYRIHPSKIAVIPHGLYDQYPILNKSQSKETLKIQGFVFLFFGLIRPYKGLSLLIKAFENLPEKIQKGSVLLIAGEAWEDRESLELIQRSHIQERILLENRYIADKDIPLFFSSADLLILPYTRASQSGVAHIGISYGIPIIASKVGGLVESLSTYQGTRFVEPSDVDSLTLAMEEHYNLNSQERFEPPDEMKWERVAEKFVQEITTFSHEGT